MMDGFDHSPYLRGIGMNHRMPDAPQAQGPNHPTMGLNLARETAP
jgi:hypothetical protein